MNSIGMPRFHKQLLLPFLLLSYPQYLEKFRLIFLIGSLYRILAKLLANRMNKVMNGLISKSQLSFMA